MEVRDYGTDYAYYDNYQLIDDNQGFTWDSESSLQRFNAIGGLAIPAPDEFKFSFMGYTGSFYLNHEGEWKVKTKQNIALKIEEEAPSSFELCYPGSQDDCVTLRRAFQKFSITTQDGTKYIFGGTNNSIEFTRYLDYDNTNYYSNITAKSWFLTAIETVDGRRITLEYQRLGWQANQTVVTQLWRQSVGNSIQNSRSDPEMKVITIINPVYLTQINAANTQLNFLVSESEELRYPYKGGVQINNIIDQHPDIKRGEAPSWYKLDQIELIQKNNQEQRQYILFSYNDDPAQRLALEQIQVFGEQTNQPPYTFSYNTTSLPEYNTLEQDHWGYYNGVNYFDQNPGPYDPTIEGAYFASRSPNETLMKAGILEQITYPTGGTTTFEFEPHYYSAVAAKYPFTLVNEGDNSMAGGLRIAKITSSPGNGYPDVEKTYHYVKDYASGGTVSSGILGDLPEYTVTTSGGGVEVWELSNNPQGPLLTTNENHVTYSEVAEELADGSYTVHTYTNHESGVYRDEAPNAILSSPDNQRWRYDPFTSRELERGNLVNQTMYTSDDRKVQEVSYTYNNDPNRFNTFIRSITVDQQVLYEGSDHPRGSIYDIRITAYQIYNYIPYQTSKTERIYDNSDENKFVETVYNYEYSNPVHHQLTQMTFTDSEEEPRKTIYQYAPDFTNNEYNSNLLTALHIYTPPLLEIRELDNAKTFQLERYFTQSNKNADHTVLDSVVTYPEGAGTNPIRVGYQYTAEGNVEEAQKQDDLPTSFVWGYQTEYPVAEFMNASADQVSYTGFEEATSNVSSEAHTGKKSHQGSYPVGLPLAGGTYTLSYWEKVGNQDWTKRQQTITASTSIGTANSLIDDVWVSPIGTLVTHFTYDPVYGRTSTTAPNGLTNLFEYDGLGRLQLARDHQRRIEQSYFYHYQE